MYPAVTISIALSVSTLAAYTPSQTFSVRLCQRHRLLALRVRALPLCSQTLSSAYTTPAAPETVCPAVTTSGPPVPPTFPMKTPWTRVFPLSFHVVEASGVKSARTGSADVQQDNSHNQRHHCQDPFVPIHPLPFAEVERPRRRGIKCPVLGGWRFQFLKSLPNRSCVDRGHTKCPQTPNCWEACRHLRFSHDTERLRPPESEPGGWDAAPPYRRASVRDVPAQR